MVTKANLTDLDIPLTIYPLKRKSPLHSLSCIIFFPPRGSSGVDFTPEKNAERTGKYMPSRRGMRGGVRCNGGLAFSVNFAGCEV